MKTSTDLPRPDQLGPRRPAIRVDRGGLTHAAQSDPYIVRLERALEHAFVLAFRAAEKAGQS